MQVPLTEIEYFILDNLADGAQPLSWLVRELHEGKRPWDVGVIITGLARLVEHQFIHYCQNPGGPNFTSPSAEIIHAQVIAVLNDGGQPWWIELTEHGQQAWETWQQTRFGS